MNKYIVNGVRVKPNGTSREYDIVPVFFVYAETKAEADSLACEILGDNVYFDIKKSES